MMSTESSSPLRDKGDSQDDLLQPSRSVENATPTRGQSRGRSLSLAIPSILSPSSSPHTPASPVTPANTRTAPQPVSQAMVEYQKLLRHVLSRLQDRPRPPNVFSQFRPKAQAGPTNITTSKKGSIENSQSARLNEDVMDTDEEETAQTNEFVSDGTWKLMVQLRDVLLLFHQQGLHIFRSGSINGPSSPTGPSLPFRRRRSSIGTGTGGQSTSTAFVDEGQALLKQCVSVLADVVLEDCRFQVSAPRPFRPPNALQSACLDVAQCLIVTQRGDAKTLHSIGMAVIPAFGTFPGSMPVRLLEFFENCLLRGMLLQLSTLRGKNRLSLQSFITDGIEQPDAVSGQPFLSIKVEQARDDFQPEESGNELWKTWSTESTQASNAVSTYAPHLPLRVYYLASLVPPLLASLLDSVEISSASREELYWMRRLLDCIITLKPDVYTDVLEVIAYHTPKARISALSVLATFWPKALGHNVIGLPVPALVQRDYAMQRDIDKLQEPWDHPYSHEFLPWRFPAAVQPRSGVIQTNVTPDISYTHCRACSLTVHDFGLFCPFCNTAVHFTCYDPPDGSLLTDYTTSSGVQKLAVTRFSYALPLRRSSVDHSRQLAGHSFRPVNLFTLCLCFVCRHPTWGSTRQALLCSRCQQCVHLGCMSGDRTVPLAQCQPVSPSEALYSIEWSLLRRSFADHYRSMLLSEEDLLRHSYESVSIIFCLLWVQLQFLNNGVAAGSILINQKNPTTAPAKANRVDDFELHYLVKLYEAYMFGDRLKKSSAFRDFRQLEGPSVLEHSCLFDVPFVHYVASLIKCSLSAPLSGPVDFLRPQVSDSTLYDQGNHPFEMVELAQIRDTIGHQFGLYSDEVAQCLLQHLRSLGFLERVDLAESLFEGPSAGQQLCIFPLPLAVDLSTSVETLFTSVEACLKDIDISVNEAGFHLLVRRCWPNGLASAYALDRLIKVILSWILEEDSTLVSIARDYVAAGKSLPGVRSSVDAQPWPTMRNLKSPGLGQTFSASGNDYLVCRKSLLEAYAISWLRSAHNRDPASYAKSLHEHCLASAAAVGETGELLTQLFPSQPSRTNLPTIDTPFADRTLRAFFKLCQSGVVFTAFDELFIFWLDEISGLPMDEPLIVKALPRLFQAEADPTGRSTLFGDLSFEQEPLLSDVVDPWRAVISTATEGLEGLSRALRWLRVLAQSGVEIPDITIRQLSALARDLGASIAEQTVLIDAIFASVWIRSLGKQYLISLIEDLHMRNEALIVTSFESNVVSIAETDFIRRSLAALLVLYGIDRGKIVSQGLVKEIEQSGLLPRRRAAGRLKGASKELDVDVGFISTIATYARSGSFVECSHIIKFLALLVTETGLFEKSEIDGIIVSNGETLCRCVWYSLRWTSLELHDIRMQLLLRVLRVDPRPFLSLLDELFDLHRPWNVRLECAGRLFTLILELNNLDVGTLERDWRKQLSSIYRFFFSLIWKDDQELVRSAIETMADSLLPSHFSYIQSAWDECLESLHNVEREDFLRFLLQLHPHFPKWSLISIGTIVDALFEDETLNETDSGFQDDERPASLLNRDSMSEPINTRNTISMLVTLGLQLIASGVPVEPFDLVKIKSFFVRDVGFPSATLKIADDGTCHVVLGEVSLPRNPEAGITCLAAAKQVLDSSLQIPVSPSMLGILNPADNAAPCLVGALMVDVVFAFFNSSINFLRASHLSLRCWLESLVIVVLKHDIKSTSLQHLETDLRAAVIKAMEISLLDITYDNRQLALTANQCYLRRWSSDGSTILSRQITTISQLLSSLDFNVEDILVAQGKAFLMSAFLRFPDNGLFVLLLKNADLPEEVFRAFDNTLKDCLKPDGTDGRQFALVDVMDKVFHYTTKRELSVTIKNMNRFVERVYCTEYSSELIRQIEIFLSMLARHTADWSATDYEGDHALRMCATIAEQNGTNSHDLLLHTETLLRATLMRFDVRIGTLMRLLKVSESIRILPSIPKAKQDDHLVLAVTESLRDALMSKGRATLQGLRAMLECAYNLAALEDTPDEKLSFSIHGRLAADCLAYLQLHPAPSSGGLMERYPDSAFPVCLEASKLFLMSLKSQKVALSASCGVGAGSAINTKAASALRIWSWLALAALSISHVPRPESNLLLVHMNDFIFTFCSVTQSIFASLPQADPSANELTHLFVSLMLWLLLAQAGERRQEDERAIWGAIWPGFERMIVRANGLGGGEAAAIAPSLSNTYTDLILFLLQSGSPLALSGAASHVALLMTMKEFSRVEGVRQKYTRTLHALSEPPPRICHDTLVSQARSNLLAAEKMNYAFEVTKKGTRVTGRQ